MIDIDFEVRRVEVSDPEETYQLLLGVTGDFALLVNERILYSEHEFPLVEFAAQTAKWLRRGERVQDDFEYESMESEQKALLWVRRQDDGWRIGSAYQGYEEPSTFSWNEIASALQQYIQELRSELSAIHRLNIEDVLQ